MPCTEISTVSMKLRHRLKWKSTKTRIKQPKVLFFFKKKKLSRAFVDPIQTLSQRENHFFLNFKIKTVPLV